MPKLYENFHILHFQKRMVSAEIIGGNMVCKTIIFKLSNSTNLLCGFYKMYGNLACGAKHISWNIYCLIDYFWNTLWLIESAPYIKPVDLTFQALNNHNVRFENNRNHKVLSLLEEYYICTVFLRLAYILLADFTI